jgi:hypothetical protein
MNLTVQWTESVNRLHDLIVGMSGRGKSRLLKEVIIPAWRKRGRLALVYDPTGQAWPGAHWVTSDGYAFIRRAKASKNCLLVVDEVRNFRDDYQLETEAHWLGTQSRNLGHKAIFSGQFTKHAHPNLRGNCSTFWAFAQNPRDAQILVTEFNVPESVRADLPRLPRGVCIRAEVCGNPVKYRTFKHPDNASVQGCIDLC